jgi:hypothetical protein
MVRSLNYIKLHYINLNIIKVLKVYTEFEYFTVF